MCFAYLYSFVVGEKRKKLKVTSDGDDSGRKKHRRVGAYNGDCSQAVGLVLEPGFSSREDIFKFVWLLKFSNSVLPIRLVKMVLK